MTDRQSSALLWWTTNSSGDLTNCKVCKRAPICVNATYLLHFFQGTKETPGRAARAGRPKSREKGNG